MLREIGIPRDIGARLADFSEVDKELLELVINVPEVSCPWNLVLALLNVFFPGVGTFLCSLWGEPCSKTQAIIGVLQFCTTFWLVGWLWSVIWSFLILKNSCSKEEAIKYYIKAQD